MPWNECLYQYHKKYGGQFLAGRDETGLLVLTYKDQPLIVDLAAEGGGRSAVYYRIQARIPVTLSKPYKLTIGPETALSSGVNTVLNAVPGLPKHAALPTDFGFPEITKKRLIRSDNHPFTKLVLGSLDFRNALLACPKDKVEVHPGPGTEGLHLITTAYSGNIYDSDWDIWPISMLSEEEAAQRVYDNFFPRMDRFLDLVRAAYSAVTQWPL